MKETGITQYDEVLFHLQHKGTITALEGFVKYYIIDLAGVIRDIRKHHIVDDEWIEKVNTSGRRVRYKKYIYVKER